jgi:hypothetical protein
METKRGGDLLSNVVDEVFGGSNQLRKQTRTNELDFFILMDAWIRRRKMLHECPSALFPFFTIRHYGEEPRQVHPTKRGVFNWV